MSAPAESMLRQEGLAHRGTALRRCWLVLATRYPEPETVASEGAETGSSNGEAEHLIAAGVPPSVAYSGRVLEHLKCEAKGEHLFAASAPLSGPSPQTPSSDEAFARQSD